MIYLDLMLCVAEKVHIDEVIEALETFRARLGLALAQFVRHRVISDLR